MVIAARVWTAFAIPAANQHAVPMAPAALVLANAATRPFPSAKPVDVSILATSVVSLEILALVPILAVPNCNVPTIAVASHHQSANREVVHVPRIVNAVEHWTAFLVNAVNRAVNATGLETFAPSLRIAVRVCSVKAMNAEKPVVVPLVSAARTMINAAAR